MLKSAQDLFFLAVLRQGQKVVVGSSLNNSPPAKMVASSKSYIQEFASDVCRGGRGRFN